RVRICRVRIRIDHCRHPHPAVHGVHADGVSLVVEAHGGVTMSATQTLIQAKVPSRKVPSKTGRAAQRALKRIPVWIAVTVLLVVVMYPMIWMILGSFKTQGEFFANPTWALPEQFDLTNYIEAFTRGNILINYRNSLLVTIPSVLLIIFLGVAAGYALEVMI